MQACPLKIRALKPLVYEMGELPREGRVFEAVGYGLARRGCAELQASRPTVEDVEAARAYGQDCMARDERAVAGAEHEEGGGYCRCATHPLPTMQSL